MKFIHERKALFYVCAQTQTRTRRNNSRIVITLISVNKSLCLIQNSDIQWKKSHPQESYLLYIYIYIPKLACSTCIIIISNNLLTFYQTLGITSVKTPDRSLNEQRCVEHSHFTTSHDDKAIAAYIYIGLLGQAVYAGGSVTGGVRACVWHTARPRPKRRVSMCLCVRHCAAHLCVGPFVRQCVGRVKIIVGRRLAKKHPFRIHPPRQMFVVLAGRKSRFCNPAGLERILVCHSRRSQQWLSLFERRDYQYITWWT